MTNNWRNLSEEQRRQKFIELYSNRSYPAGKSHGAIKLARDLAKNTNKSDYNHFKVLIEGLPIIEMAIKYNIELEYLFICPEDIYSEEILDLLPKLISLANTTLDVSPKVFDLITKKGNSNGLAAIGKITEKKINNLKVSDDLVIVLDGLETPGNIGSIIRSADAVDAKAIIFTNRQAHLYHPLMIRSSRGACFKLPIIESDVKEAQKFLINNDYEIVLADPSADKYYYQHSYKKPTALVMGSERFGISQDWFDKKYSAVSIPMLGDCDSLNVSIATTVLLYEIRLQKNKKLTR